MTTVFIGGSAGTTGLQIRRRLAERKDLQVAELPEALRKDPNARKEALNNADIAFLCLPDDAARESVSLIDDGNDSTAIIDTSTAHRTAADWVYGFAELKGQREKIMASKRIANPGCHAGGVISLLRPLIEEGLLPSDAHCSCYSLTGYSGGGKKMIAEYEADEVSPLLAGPRMYALTQAHKHLPEITAQSGLTVTPVFCPVVAPFYSGMEVTIPLFSDQINATVKEIKDLYRTYYTDGVVSFAEEGDENGFLSASALSGTDRMKIAVFGNEDRILLTSVFDNLGKGACGSAIQNMNLLLGLPETTGLNL